MMIHLFMPPDSPPDEFLVPIVIFGGGGGGGGAAQFGAGVLEVGRVWFGTDCPTPIAKGCCVAGVGVCTGTRLVCRF